MTAANLGERQAPKTILGQEAMLDPGLTQFQRTALQTLVQFANHSASADRLAWAMGYRPARRGRLAVSRALQTLLDPSSNLGTVGHYVTRQPPRDQWGAATWCLRHAHTQRVDADNQPCVWRGDGHSPEGMGKGHWALIEASDTPTPADTPHSPKRRIR